LPEGAGERCSQRVPGAIQPAIAERFGVQALPSLVFLEGGQRVDTLVGNVSKAVLAGRLRALCY
jgi:thioredoxin-like negative regulator of GroEL